MHNLELALLIILIAIFLVLLVLAVMVVVMILKILQNVRNVSQKVSDTADNIPGFLKFMGKKLAPVALSTFVGALLKRAKNKHDSKEAGDE
mgnify:CR=1 FL=1